jgi:heterotetrameric sarcosine oxidase delta subunit
MRAYALPLSLRVARLQRLPVYESIIVVGKALADKATSYSKAVVSFLLTCPNCGTREVTDFGFGGEVSRRPRERPTLRELGAYNYFRRNVAGVQREWWYHRSGCRAWFLADRDTRTNEVLWTALPEEAPAP